MSHPVYVLLPDGVDWPPVPDTAAQASAPVRWYLRQLMPEAATQTAVLIPGERAERDRRIADVAQRAGDLGGMAVDGHTQQPIDPAAHGTAAS